MNPEVQMTLEEAVADTLGFLTGLDVAYTPELNRFQSVTRALNKALRLITLEHEWSFYHDVIDVGTTKTGQTDFKLSPRYRVRIMTDDSVRLVTPGGTGYIRVWAYILPRESLHKYQNRNGLWVAVSGRRVEFSRPLRRYESGLKIMVPVMREPKMFRLPAEHEDVPREILDQPVDFEYPELVIAKACELIAQSDPIMQPRAQTLESQYKDMMFALKSRDEDSTDSPYLNEFLVPIGGTLEGSHSHPLSHGHPHSDERF